MRSSSRNSGLLATSALGVLLLSGAPPALAQTAESLAAQHALEAMQQALQTRQSYDLYGLRFASGDAAIDPQSAVLLDDIATAMRNFPEWNLRIVGHTDATGDEILNMTLSQQRSDAVKAALVERGVDAGRLEAAGLGERQPAATNTTPEGRALNRRVELVRYTVSEEAKRRLKAMSDYIASQDMISFDYDSVLEVVTTADQKLALSSSGTVTLDRPDHVRATRSGGFLDISMVFDGKTFSLLGGNTGLYTQIDMPGTLDEMVDRLRETFDRALPAADLLMSDPYEALMSNTYDSKDLGSGVVGGVECDYLAFRGADVDWQIWIAQGAQPYPCRYVITTRDLPHAPQYTVQFRDWRTGDQAETGDYAFVPPADGTRIEIADIDAKLGELPSHFTAADAE